MIISTSYIANLDRSKSATFKVTICHAELESRMLLFSYNDTQDSSLVSFKNDFILPFWFLTFKCMLSSRKTLS